MQCGAGGLLFFSCPILLTFSLSSSPFQSFILYLLLLLLFISTFHNLFFFFFFFFFFQFLSLSFLFFRSSIPQLLISIFHSITFTNIILTTSLTLFLLPHFSYLLLPSPPSFLFLYIPPFSYHSPLSLTSVSCSSNFITCRISSTLLLLLPFLSSFFSFIYFVFTFTF